jgi:D-serine deaminase-like pyridoxal phosphate-dependent protein
LRAGRRSANIVAVAGGVDRRAFLGAGAAGIAAVSGVPAAASGARRRSPQPPLGSGGTPMSLDELHALARAEGRGHPLALLDLAAVDRNLGVLVEFGREHGLAVRPALKSFRSARLAAYVLQRLPEPRGLVFDLSQVDEIVAHAPPGTDLLMGYPPTFGEVAAHLAGRPPRGQRAHTLRLLIDSVPLAEHVARLAAATPRRLPLDVALELDVGMGRGGLGDAAEVAALLGVLRANRRALRLGAVLGYDGHATLDGNPAYRRLVAAQAQDAYRRLLAAIEAANDGLFDPARLIRNGPASSNYRNWVGGPANEMSPGSAVVRAGYLEGGFDVEGLEPALTLAGAVRRITSDHPSVPASGQTAPGASEMEIVVQGVGDAGEVVRPAGAREDELSGGGDALVVPKGSLAHGDYVLYRPTQAEDGVRRVHALTAVREGRVVRRWPVERRPGGGRA